PAVRSHDDGVTFLLPRRREDRLPWRRGDRRNAAEHDASRARLGFDGAQDAVGLLLALRCIFLARYRLEYHTIRVDRQWIIGRSMKSGQPGAEGLGQSDRVRSRFERKPGAVGGHENVTIHGDLLHNSFAAMFLRRRRQRAGAAALAVSANVLASGNKERTRSVDGELQDRS